MTCRALAKIAARVMAGESLDVAFAAHTPGQAGQPQAQSHRCQGGRFARLKVKPLQSYFAA